MKCLFMVAITWALAMLVAAYDGKVGEPEPDRDLSQDSHQARDTITVEACGGGGWTLVMKIDGNKDTFTYDSKLWTNKETYYPGASLKLDSTETKQSTYWTKSFAKICLGMNFVGETRFVVINQTASSLYSLIADGQYRPTSLGRDKWKSLIGCEGSLQLNCNKEGFNSFILDKDYMPKVRIGILANNQNDCITPDSRIGFGASGWPDDSNTCGNAATREWHPDNGAKGIKAMGYILVQ